MTAVLVAPPSPVVYGRAEPRIAPPRPLRSDVDAFRREAECIGIDPFPWQDIAGLYLNALDANDHYLYPEVPVVVSRQNGKTEILVPHICSRLRMGRRIMHTAQNRELPREVFGRVADHLYAKHWAEMTRKPRFANGQEEIRLHNGGHYRIVAPTRGGARGPSNDDLVIDEVREMDNNDFIAAAKPTLNASPNPQVVYTSNAGDQTSVVLNALRLRADQDPSLAYLEWSAAPELAANDIEGWIQSNPSMGHMPQIQDNLAREYRAHKLAGTLAIFETEHLCRWVLSMREHLVDSAAWMLCEADQLSRPRRAYLGVSLDPKGKRASVALAWRQPDETIALRQLFDVTGDPIDTDALGKDIAAAATKHGVLVTGHDPLTDAELAKYPRKSEAIAGQKFANASARFAVLVEAQRLRWHDADDVTDDLTWTTRKAHDTTGSFQAVRADDDRPITAVLAAIRAVWLASNPVVGPPRVY